MTSFFGCNDWEGTRSIIKFNLHPSANASSDLMISRTPCNTSSPTQPFLAIRRVYSPCSEARSSARASVMASSMQTAAPLSPSLSVAQMKARASISLLLSFSLELLSSLPRPAPEESVGDGDSGEYIRTGSIR